MFAPAPVDSRDGPLPQCAWLARPPPPRRHSESRLTRRALDKRGGAKGSAPRDLASSFPGWDISDIPRPLFLPFKTNGPEDGSGVNKLQPGAKSGLPPVFMNKVLLELGHAHSLMYLPRLLSVCRGRAEQLPPRPHGPQSQSCVGPGQPVLWIDLAVAPATC